MRLPIVPPCSPVPHSPLVMVSRYFYAHACRLHRGAQSTCEPWLGYDCPLLCAPSSNQANHHPAASLPRILGFTHLHLAAISATAICNAHPLRHLVRAGTKYAPRLDQCSRPCSLCSSAPVAPNHVGRRSRTPERRQEKQPLCRTWEKVSQQFNTAHSSYSQSLATSLSSLINQTAESARGHCVCHDDPTATLALAKSL